MPTIQLDVSKEVWNEVHLEYTLFQYISLYPAFHKTNQWIAVLCFRDISNPRTFSRPENQ